MLTNKENCHVCPQGFFGNNGINVTDPLRRGAVGTLPGLYTRCFHTESSGVHGSNPLLHPGLCLRDIFHDLIDSTNENHVLGPEHHRPDTIARGVYIVKLPVFSDGIAATEKEVSEEDLSPQFAPPPPGKPPGLRDSKAL